MKGLLLTAGEDGVVCLYDVIRRYEPIKIIPVELQGDEVDACFSHDSKQFAILGTHASTIFIWDSFTLTLKFRINTSGTIVEKICFSPNGQDILALTRSLEYKVKYYGLNGFEGIFIKELTGLHVDSKITALEVSRNSKYLFTGGTDTLLKIWDYATQPNVLNCQAFLGHSSEVSFIKFLYNGRMVVTSGTGNLIYFWEFHGDTSPIMLPESRKKQEPVKN